MEVAHFLTRISEHDCMLHETDLSCIRFGHFNGAFQCQALCLFVKVCGVYRGPHIVFINQRLIVAHLRDLFILQHKLIIVSIMINYSFDMLSHHVI